MNTRIVAGAAFAVMLGAGLFSMTPANADILQASSGATVDAGFPVLTGPGVTVLTPAGSYETAPAPRMSTAGDTEVKKEIKAQIKNYSWPSQARVAQSYKKTTVRMSTRTY